MLRIKAVDETQRIVTFTGPTRSNSDWGLLKAQMRFLVDNVPEALDTPGQWYLDRAAGRESSVTGDWQLSMSDVRPLPGVAASGEVAAVMPTWTQRVNEVPSTQS